MVYKWLSGERAPQAANLKALASEFGKATYWLSTGREAPLRPDEAVNAAEATKSTDPIRFDVAQLRHLAETSHLESAARENETCRRLVRDLVDAVAAHFRREDG